MKKTSILLKHIFMFLLLVFTFSCCTQEPKFSEDADVMDTPYEIDSLSKAADFTVRGVSYYRVKYIVIHCTGGTLRNMTKKEMDKIWRERGWDRAGYQYVINPDGSIITYYGGVDNCVLTNKNKVNGVKDFNSSSISISTVGGYKKDDRTAIQKEVLHKLVKSLVEVCPEDIKIRSHYQMPNVHKACPRYDARAEFDYLLKKE